MTETNKKISLRIKLLLVSITPGIFLIGYNIGTGSIVTTASAGAKTGMMLILQNKKELIIGCSENALSFLELQQEGKKRMGIEEFLRGFSFA